MINFEKKWFEKKNTHNNKSGINKFQTLDQYKKQDLDE